MGNAERNSAVAVCMSLKPLLILLFAALWIPAARADLHYKVTCEMTSGPLQQLNGLAPGGDLLAECNQDFYRKGERELSRGKSTATLTDYKQGTQTTIDYQAKTWTRQSLAEIARNMKAAQAANAGEGAPKLKLRPGNPTRDVHGLKATGKIGQLQLELPVSGNPADPKLKLLMEIEVWRSQELAGAQENALWIAERKKAGGESAHLLESMLGGLPGAEDVLELNEPEAGLPIEIRIATRFLALEKAQLGDGVADPLGMAAVLQKGGTVMDMKMTFSGHSTEAIPVSLFEIPKDFRELKP